MDECPHPPAATTRAHVTEEAALVHIDHAELAAKLDVTPKPARPTSKNPRPEGTELRQIIEAIGLDVRYDYRRGRIEFKLPDDYYRHRAGTWYVLDGNSDAVLYSFIEDAIHPLKLGTEFFERSVKALAQRQHVDSFLLDYVQHLPEWDGESRLWSCLAECFDINDDLYEGNQLRAGHAVQLLLASVAGRVNHPGMKADITPVLAGDGDGGSGKSSFVEHLLPDPQWFARMNYRRLNKGTQHEITMGRVIVELPEMVGLWETTREMIKDYMTETYDDFRIPWEKRAIRHNRVHVFCGTSNSMNRLFFDDLAFVRRFLPVYVLNDPSVAYRRVTGYLAANRDQLYAEAFARFPDGYGADELEAVRQLQRSLPDSIRARHFTAEVVDDLSDEDIEGFTLTEIIDSTDYRRNFSARDKQRLATLLRDRGFEAYQRRVDGIRGRYWHQNGPPLDDAPQVYDEF